LTELLNPNETKKKKGKRGHQGPKPPFLNLTRTIGGELYYSQAHEPNKPPPEREGEGEEIAGEQAVAGWAATDVTPWRPWFTLCHVKERGEIERIERNEVQARRQHQRR